MSEDKPLRKLSECGKRTVKYVGCPFCKEVFIDDTEGVLFCPNNTSANHPNSEKLVSLTAVTPGEAKMRIQVIHPTIQMH
jgi:hypothetical protein